MRLAITGASGFVGRALIRAAVQRGFEVIAFTRDPSRHVGDCVETRRFALDVVPDFRDCEAIVHLAGENIFGWWSAAKKRRILESRVQGTRRVVEGIQALRTPPEVFVSGSAFGYYADGGDRELTEDAPPGSGFLAEVCAQWEAEAEPAALVCRLVKVRVSNVLGPGGLLGVLRPIFRLGLGGQLGHGRQWMPWIQVEDLVALQLFAVENMAVRGPLNATAPWPVRNAEFTRCLARQLHRPAWFRVPAFMLRYLFGDLGHGMMKSVRLVPLAAAAQGFRFRTSELEPALQLSLR